ncbi:siderophore-interacting protein [Nocardia ignorata]|uniref:NADPH-dependent ferric siderophore reductase n=1 Tax=Nocardia ignorata TaxID=145285 RepID=A0A4R6PP87_NOCIG|nr:siderophore-interacting protein [Nocardia ignorata]TDP39719.1 NADPH-dependent ferric siderophore reductase [Nocardia ignorata]
MGKGFNGLMVKAWGGSDYRLTVTANEQITDKFVRISFTAGGLLADNPVHPTQWIRLWIPDEHSDKLHHRGYTLVNQNPAEDTVCIDFALHDGPAANWARRAKPGDPLDASVLGSDFQLPEQTPSEYVVFGDTASLPAINSLLDAIGDTPTRVWLEWQYESDTTIPVHNKPHHTVTWVQRIDDGRLLREAASAMTCPADAFAWVACDGHTTRSIVKTLKTHHALPKSAIKYQAYWK